MTSHTTSLNEDKNQQTLYLQDGRILSYAEYGDLTGKPLFFFHGGNDSRLEAAIVDETAQQMRVRVIAPDRPGYGRSTFQPNRTFLDWPADVLALANALELQRFAVVGHSGGGPHAAAVANATPERLTGVGLISSAAPPGSSNKGMHPLFRLINFFMGSSPKLHRRITEQTAVQVQDTPEKFFTQWGRMSPADGRLFQSRPAVREMIAAEMQEALHQGIDAILQEHPLYKQPWGFELTEIALPVHVWHGLADVHISQDVPHFVPNEGHFSILANYQADILALAVNDERAT